MISRTQNLEEVLLVSFQDLVYNWLESPSNKMKDAMIYYVEK